MTEGAALAELLREVKDARKSFNGLASKAQFDQLERSVNELYARAGRPGPGGFGAGEAAERKDAAAWLETKHAIMAPRDEGLADRYAPSPSEIDEAMLARKAISRLFRHGDERRLDPMERKSLSQFSFGNSGWILPPQISSTVLSCLTDPTDLGALMRNETISGPSLVFPLDNAEMDAAWACETDCWVNQPAHRLEDVGQIEVKPEPVRAIVCATSSLLADSSFDIQQWVMRKAQRAFRGKISAAVMAGDGVGKPQGILHATSGIPVCDVGDGTLPGTLTWQDLVLLKYQLPEQWLTGGSYLMNTRTLGLVLTMSDASGRPIWAPLPAFAPGGASGIGMSIAGSPVQIASQMPDVLPGATPVAFGNWPEAYAVVTRSGLTMLPDPYSHGWCTLFKFEARVGGAVLCPGAARLLRIR
jgi:HK97 family phage major capsid protein